MSVTVVYDATHANVGSLPKRIQTAFYVTGSGTVPETASDFAAFPNAVLIDQSPNTSSWDSTADIDDVESGAVLVTEIASRAKMRMAAFKANIRPMQRRPGVYMSAGQISSVVNALIKGGVNNGVGLWVANWGLAETTAANDVAFAAGPFPIIGVQYKNAGPYDISIFSTQWLTDVAGNAAHAVLPMSQKGTVHSITTNLNAQVMTTDGGNTWRYVP